MLLLQQPDTLTASAVSAKRVVSPPTDATSGEKLQRSVNLADAIRDFSGIQLRDYGGAGGLKTIKALCGPFPQIKFLPTGGINQNNAAEYYKNPKILAVGGSWMVTKDMVNAGDFEGITAKSKAATDLFKEIRG